MLTGSVSKGKMGIYYNFYHCSSSYGGRFKAETTNDTFIKQLKYLIPEEGMIDIFVEAFIEDFNTQTKKQNQERISLLTQIEEDEYFFLKKDCIDKIEQLENRLNNLSSVNTEIKDLFKSALKRLQILTYAIRRGIQKKRDVL